MKGHAPYLFVLSFFVTISLLCGVAIAEGPGFIDLNGDGINDNAKDSDSDLIPNGKDPDYKGPKYMKSDMSKGFVDLNGDGINDNAIDSDGDGIPNGQDEDYTKPSDGTGQQRGKTVRNKLGFIDEDADGIADAKEREDSKTAQVRRKVKFKGGRTVQALADKGVELAPSAIRDRDMKRLRDSSCDNSGPIRLQKTKRISR